MKMELVCTKFQSRIKQRSAWQGQNVLKLGQNGANVTINGYSFSCQKAAIALSKLLDRITVEDFILNDMSEIPFDVLSALCHTVVKHKDFVSLKRIQFDCFF